MSELLKPFAIDLCHGKGGWTNGFLAEGYRVIGYDTVRYPEYQGFHCDGDVRELARSLMQRSYTWEDLRRAFVIVASPPCEEYSRHQMPWTLARNPPEPDLTIWQACVSIASALGLPLVIENVRMAQKWHGSAKWHSGSYYLWGDVPALMPEVIHRKKESLSSGRRLERAMVPEDLSRWIARCFAPANSVGTSSRRNLGDMAVPTAAERGLENDRSV